MEILKNRKKIYEDYVGMISSFDAFCNILDSCTQNHECLAVKLSGSSNDMRDQVFWYKAEMHVPFKVGHKKIWDFHSSFYNKTYETDRNEEQEEVDRLLKKFHNTKKLKIFVSKTSGDILDAEEYD